MDDISLPFQADIGFHSVTYVIKINEQTCETCLSEHLIYYCFLVLHPDFSPMWVRSGPHVVVSLQQIWPIYNQPALWVLACFYYMGHKWLLGEFRLVAYGPDTCHTAHWFLGELCLFACGPHMSNTQFEGESRAHCSKLSFKEKTTYDAVILEKTGLQHLE